MKFVQPSFDVRVHRDAGRRGGRPRLRRAPFRGVQPLSLFQHNSISRFILQARCYLVRPPEFPRRPRIIRHLPSYNNGTEGLAPTPPTPPPPPPALAAGYARALVLVDISNSYVISWVLSGLQRELVATLYRLCSRLSSPQTRSAKRKEKEAAHSRESGATGMDEDGNIVGFVRTTRKTAHE